MVKFEEHRFQIDCPECGAPINCTATPRPPGLHHVFDIECNGKVVGQWESYVYLTGCEHADALMRGPGGGGGEALPLSLPKAA